MTKRETTRASQDKKDTNARSQRTKRINLIVPTELYSELTKIADEADVTTLDLLRKFIKLGIITYEIGKKKDSALIIREGETERQIILI